MNVAGLAVGVLVAAVGGSTVAAFRPRVGLAGTLRARALAAPGWFRSAVVMLSPDRDADAAWPWTVAAVVVSACVAAAFVPGLLVVFALGVGAVALLGRVRAAARVRRPLGDLPAAVDALVAALAAGASPRQAVEVVAAGSASGDLGRAVRLMERGLPLQASLDRWASFHARTDAALVSDALALAGQSGGSLVGALRGVGDTLRDREALAREASALATQARLSAVVLVVAPVGFAALAATLDAGVRRVLLGTPLGWTCLAVGALLDLIGARWMRLVVEGVTR